MYFFKTLAYNILSLIVTPQAKSMDIGITSNPNPVRLKIIELDVVDIITIVSIDFNIIDNVLYFLFSFLDLLFYLRSMQSFLYGY